MKKKNPPKPKKKVPKTKGSTWSRMNGHESMVPTAVRSTLTHLAREALIAAHQLTTTEERVEHCMQVIDKIGAPPVQITEWIDMLQELLRECEERLQLARQDQAREAKGAKL